MVGLAFDDDTAVFQGLGHFALPNRERGETQAEKRAVRVVADRVAEFAQSRGIVPRGECDAAFQEVAERLGLFLVLGQGRLDRLSDG